MSESQEHKKLKNILGTLLGKKECKAGQGRVDACSDKVTAEIVCAKIEDQRVCRVDFRHQPDTKGGTQRRPAPFATLRFSTKEIEAFDKVLLEAGIKAKSGTA